MVRADNRLSALEKWHFIQVKVNLTVGKNGSSDMEPSPLLAASQCLSGKSISPFNVFKIFLLISWGPFPSYEQWHANFN